MKAFIYGLWMLVGTYTGSGSEGIYVYRFDPVTAKAEYMGMAAVENPSYLTASADGETVYAVSENGEGETSWANTFTFDRATGMLTPVDREATSGAAPCNITTDGRIVVTANYGGGDVSVFGVKRGGGLSPLRQTLRLSESAGASHMHCVKVSPDGRWLFAADLGSDRLVRWRLRKNGRIDAGSLKTFALPVGSGPRHFVFDGTGRYLYLINELSGTAIAFRYNRGELEQFQTVQADPSAGRGSADIVLTPDGRYLYTSHRLKNDGVTKFDVSPADGTLIPAGYLTTGLHPRNLAITPDGRWLTVAARDSGRVDLFAIDPATGDLTPVGDPLTLDKPVCVLFIPTLQ
ncbi:MAG: lactonase family protein [Alistipes sp.]|jgi:6-phosphogluconolactonase (cycloisomerase 2 family)|nr:lactonase family protein [Alistipes sp.]